MLIRLFEAESVAQNFSSVRGSSRPCSSTTSSVLTLLSKVRGSSRLCPSTTLLYLLNFLIHFNRLKTIERKYEYL